MAQARACANLARYLLLAYSYAGGLFSLEIEVAKKS
jgi:hypothetical protein